MKKVMRIVMMMMQMLMMMMRNMVVVDEVSCSSNFQIYFFGCVMMNSMFALYYSLDLYLLSSDVMFKINRHLAVKLQI